MEIQIQIQTSNADFPTPTLLSIRDQLEDELMNYSEMTIVDVGSGLGVMDIVLETKESKPAITIIQDLLEKHQIQEISTIKVKKNKKSRIKVKEGDIVAIPLEENLFAVGIILHVSKYWRNSIMVGYYDEFFTSLADINIDALGNRFIFTPNYTGKQIITEGDWEIVGHSQKLLSVAEIPELVSVTTVFYKDEVVKRLPSIAATEDYTMLTGQGRIFVENKLRKYFSQNQSERE